MDTFNIRVKIHKCQKNYRNTNKEYENFKDVINDDVLLCGVDDTPMLDDEEAYQFAYTICEEVLKTSTNDEDAIFLFQEYLQLISARAKGFSYEIICDNNDGLSKQILGILWMTATM